MYIILGILLSLAFSRSLSCSRSLSLPHTQRRYRNIKRQIWKENHLYCLRRGREQRKSTHAIAAVEQDDQLHQHRSVNAYLRAYVTHALKDAREESTEDAPAWVPHIHQPLASEGAAPIHTQTNRDTRILMYKCVCTCTSASYSSTPSLRGCCTCIYTYVAVYIYTQYVYVYIHLYIDILLHILVYNLYITYTYMHTYIHTYVYTYIHTYI